MDLYYHKPMGNGTVRTKFRLDPKPSFERPPVLTTLDHTGAVLSPRVAPAKSTASAPPTAREEPANEGFAPVATWPSLEQALHRPGTSGSGHHDSNCVRCYRIKKKCSRTYPLCDYCQRSGTVCRYVERRRKKQRLEEPVLPLADKPNTLSISSLVHRDGMDEPFRNIDVFNTDTASVGVPRATAKQLKQPVLFGESLRALVRGKQFLSVHRKLVAGAMQSCGTPVHPLADELLVVRAISDQTLPSAFMHTFIANYEWKYPFMPLEPLLRRFNSLNFENETLVNLDIYLAMAIGCLIYDSNHSTQHHHAYFSDALVESIIEVVPYVFVPHEDVEATNVLLLLAIYALNVCNTAFIWSILGYLDRALVNMTEFGARRAETPRSDASAVRKRLFWAVFNLDKELSLMLDKPSQFIPTSLIPDGSELRSDLSDGELPHLAALMTSTVELHKLQDHMLWFTLGLAPATAAALMQYSSDLEAWRVRLLLLIHTEYADLPLLQNYIGLVNLDYYYLLIEMDQLLPTDSFQSTLQFLSNSFSLLLSVQSEKKGVVCTSMHSLFWYLKFFKVVKYKLLLLVRVLSSDISKLDLNSRLNDCNSNVQLMLNLIKFLLQNGSAPHCFEPRLKRYAGHLTSVNGMLMTFNPLAALDEEKLRILQSMEANLEKVRGEKDALDDLDADSNERRADERTDEQTNETKG